MSNLRAGLLIFVYALLFAVGTPGLDHMRSKMSATEEQRLRNRAGDTVADLTQFAVRINKNIRAPIKRKLGGFQPVFRIRQAWNLYRDGPRNVYRLEIRVDGEPVYRSEHPELDWLEPQLRNRRLRPVVESTVKKFKSANWRGLSRLVVSRARAQWPEAQRVELIALKGKRPGKRLRPQHRIIASAPEWSVEKTK